MPDKRLLIGDLLDTYGALLTEKQRYMLELYYCDDLSLAEVAENVGITRQGVRDAIKRSEQQLVEMEERLGLAKRFRTIQETLAQICDLALEIKELNAGENPQIDEDIVKIIKAAEKLAED